MRHLYRGANDNWRKAWRAIVRYFTSDGVTDPAYANAINHQRAELETAELTEGL